MRKTKYLVEYCNSLDRPYTARFSDWIHALEFAQTMAIRYAQSAEIVHHTGLVAQFNPDGSLTPKFEHLKHIFDLEDKKGAN